MASENVVAEARARLGREQSELAGKGAGLADAALRMAAESQRLEEEKRNWAAGEGGRRDALQKLDDAKIEWERLKVTIRS